MANAERRKAAIAAAAEEKKLAIQQMLDGEAARLEGAYESSIDRVRSNAGSQRQAIYAALESENAKVNAAAEAEVARLETGVAERKDAVRGKAEEKAKSIESTGDQEAGRAEGGTEERSRRAGEMGERKVEQYRGGTNGQEIATAIREEVASVVSGLHETSSELSSGLRDRAAEIATHFRDEAEEITSEFDSPLGDASDQILENRDKTLETLQEMADKAAESITEEEGKLIEKLSEDRQTVPGQLREFGPALAESFDGRTTEAHSKIDAETTRTSEELTSFAEETRDGGWYPPFIEEARADVLAAISENESEIDEFATQTVSRFGEVAENARQEVTPAITALVNALEQASTAFVSGVSQMAGDVAGQMSEASAKGERSMSVVTEEVTKELDKAATKADSDWQQQLVEKQRELAGEVDEALSSQDSTLSDLAAQLDQRARRAADPGILESIFDFVVGVFEGFALGAWELLKGLWKAIREPLFWIVVAVVAVVLIIAVIVLVIKGAAVLAAIGAVLAFAGKVLLVIGVIAGVIAAGYYIYLMITRPELSWRERGRLLGKALFEVVMAFIGTGILKRLGVLAQVNKLRQFVARVGGVARALRLINKVPNLEKLVPLLDKVGDAEKLLQLLDKVSDAENLIKLLDRVSDVDKLLQLLDKVSDAGKLLKLLDKVSDVDKLLQLLDKVADADKLLKLLDKVSDVDKLIRLIDKVSDAGKLRQLLDKVPDADKLLAALDKVTDAGLLLRMLDKVNDVDKIIQLVDKVGDANKAAQLIDRSADIDKLLKALDKIPNADDLIRILNTVDADAVAALVAVIDKATDVTKLEDLITIIGKTRGDMELLAKMFDKITDSRILSDYFQKAGVATQRPNADLLDMILQVAKDRTTDPTRVSKLLDIAAGNAVEFQRLAEAVPRFKFTPPPAGPQPANLYGQYNSVDMHHFCGRHTYDHWEFLNPNNYNASTTTFWPENTTPSAIAGYVQEALNQMAGPPPNFLGNWQATDLTISPGPIRIGASPDPSGVGLWIGQFYPKTGETFTRAMMKAFKAIFYP